MPNTPTALDLFCGAGGLSLGLRRAGFDVVAAVDHDAAAVRTYQRNLGSHVRRASIYDLKPHDLLRELGMTPGECVLLTGGPPCQGFSVQRRGSDEDPRNHLVLEFLRFVEGVLPRFFVMENVAGLNSKRGRPFLDEIFRRVEAIGYHCRLEKLDAGAFGVPQFRSRVFLVGEGATGGPPVFRFPVPVNPHLRRTVRDAIGDLPSPPADGSPHQGVPNHYREANLSALNIERIKHVPQGGGREHLPEHLQLPCHRNNPSHRHMDVYGRLSWDAPAGTITAMFDSFTRGRFGHPEEHRSITLREGARLQTFPDDFVFEGSREECARQIGNAVPPLLAELLGRAVIAAAATRPEPTLHRPRPTARQEPLPFGEPVQRSA